MHSGLIQSGVPHLLSGEVRQEDIPFRTGKRPVPLSLPPDEERLVEAIATGDRAAADIARAAGEGFDPGTRPDYHDAGKPGAASSGSAASCEAAGDAAGATQAQCPRALGGVDGGSSRREC